MGASPSQSPRRAAWRSRPCCRSPTRACRSRRRSDRSSSRARTLPSTCSSYAPRTSPNTCRTASSTLASPAPTSSPRRRPRPRRSPPSPASADARSVAVPADVGVASAADLEGLRVATSYPVSTRRLLSERGVTCELVPVSARSRRRRVSVWPTRSSTSSRSGSTLSANGLRRVVDLLPSQAVLVGGRAAGEHPEEVARLGLMLVGVAAARRRRYVMMNATVGDPPAIRAVLPSMGALTVLQLAEEGEIAPRRRRRGRRLDTAARAQGGRRILHPRRPGREARAEKRSHRRRTRGRGADRADVRDRVTSPLSNGRSASTGRAQTGSVSPRSGSTRPRSRPRCSTRCDR